jgi:hypothetical protein
MPDRKRIRVEGDSAAAIARALSEIQGHLVVEEDAMELDLLVLDAKSPEDLRKMDDRVPKIAVVRRRLRASEQQAFKDAGARVVIDAESNVLDAAFAFSDLLFTSSLQGRRYGRAYGGTTVRFRALDDSVCGAGILLDMGRRGALIVSDCRVGEGRPIELEIGLSDRTIPLRARVAFSEKRSEHEIAIEFAIDDHEVAPKLFALCPDQIEAEVARERGSSLVANAKR